MEAQGEPLADTLCRLALERMGKSLEALMKDGQKRNIGIFHHEGVAYCFDLSWAKEGREYDFLLEVIEVMPNQRKDRKPKTTLVATRQFTQKG